MDRDEKDHIAVIEQIDECKGCHYENRRIPGGKTNPNWEVTIEDKTYFVKIPRVETEVFINRMEWLVESIKDAIYIKLILGAGSC